MTTKRLSHPTTGSSLLWLSLRWRNNNNKKILLTSPKKFPKRSLQLFWTLGPYDFEWSMQKKFYFLVFIEGPSVHPSINPPPKTSLTKPNTNSSHSWMFFSIFLFLENNFFSFLNLPYSLLCFFFPFFCLI